jgi:hypothetical protein
MSVIFSIMNIPVFTLHKNNKVQFVDHDKYSDVVTQSKLNKNTIVLIEHCFFENNKNIAISELIKNYEFLFNALHPKTVKWTENIRNKENNEIKDLIYRKMHNNCIKFDMHNILGNEISYFNHSDEPNCTK